MTDLVRMADSNVTGDGIKPLHKHVLWNRCKRMGNYSYSPAGRGYFEVPVDRTASRENVCTQKNCQTTRTSS